jgi:hypothetical protein
VTVKTRGVIGKRIVAVQQQRTRSNFGTNVYHVQSLLLDDGTRILLNVVELDDRDPEVYAVDGIVLAPKKDR